MEKYNPNKVILVTGGSGQIGIDLKAISKDKEINFLFPSSSELDLSKNSLIADYCNKVHPDLIINLGAYTNVDNAEVEKEKALLVNHSAVKELGNFCFDNKIGIIHFSTDYVFGNSKGPHKANDIKSPINHYGLSKNYSEDDLIKINPNSLIVRLASVFSDKGENFVKTISNLILDNKQINVVSDQKISLTYAGDVATIIMLLIHFYFLKNNFKFLNSNFIHFTNNGYTDWFSVAKLIQSEIKNSKDNNQSTLSNILSKDWDSKAKRPLDSRLYVDNNWFKSKGMVIPRWETRVKKVVSSILLNSKKEF